MAASRHVSAADETQLAKMMAEFAEMHCGFGPEGTHDELPKLVSESDSASPISFRERLQTLLTPCVQDHIAPRPQRVLVYDSKAYRRWLLSARDPHVKQDDDIQSRLLCMYGPPGSGKSVMAKMVAECLEQQGWIACFFSFCAMDESKRTMIHLLSTILFQLLQQLEDRGMGVASEQSPWKEAYEALQGSDGGHGVTIGKQGLARALNMALSLRGTEEPSPVYIIIDGINEADAPWTSTDGSAYHDTITDLLGGHPCLAVMLSGRQSLLPDVQHEVEMTISSLKNSFADLVEKEIDDSSALASQTPEVRQKIWKAILSHVETVPASATFLWVSLVFKQLNQLDPSSPLFHRQLNEALESLPQDLDAAYSNLFSGLTRRLGGQPGQPSEAMRRAHDLLSIIIHAVRPLTVDELCHAYAARIYSSSSESVRADPGSDNDAPSLTTLQNLLVAKKDIVDVCGDFVTIGINGCVYLTHISVAEFLTRPRKQWPDADDQILFYWEDAEHGQDAMASTCLAYLNMVDFGYPLSDEENAHAALVARHPFFPYAATGFAQHASNSRGRLISPSAVSSSFTAGLAPRIRGFVASQKACGWLEFIVRKLVADIDQPEVIAVSDSLQDIVDKAHNRQPGVILERIRKEDHRRGEVFGQSSPRSVSWKFILFWAEIILDDKSDPLQDNMDGPAACDYRVQDSLLADETARIGAELSKTRGQRKLQTMMEPSELPSRPGRIAEKTTLDIAVTEDGTGAQGMSSVSQHRMIRSLGPVAASLASNRAVKAMASSARALQGLAGNTRALFQFSPDALIQNRSAIFLRTLVAMARPLPVMASLSMGMTYHAATRFEEALVFYQVALEKQVGQVGIVHAFALYSASLCMDWDDIEIKERSMQKAAAMLEKLPKTPQHSLLHWFVTVRRVHIFGDLVSRRVEAYTVLKELEKEVAAYLGEALPGSKASPSLGSLRLSPFKRYLFQSSIWRGQMSMLWNDIAEAYALGSYQEDAERLYRHSIEYCKQSKPPRGAVARSLATAEKKLRRIKTCHCMECFVNGAGFCERAETEE